MPISHRRLSEAPQVSQPEVTLHPSRAHTSSQQAMLLAHLCVTAFQMCGATRSWVFGGAGDAQ